MILFADEFDRGPAGPSGKVAGDVGGQVKGMVCQQIAGEAKGEVRLRACCEGMFGKNCGHPRSDIAELRALQEEVALS